MKKLALPFAISAALLQGCGSDSAGTANLTLGLTDAPVDGADKVVVEFSGVALKTGGEVIDIQFDEPKSIDLLSLQGSASEPLLTDESLPAGEYQWVRLDVNTSNDMDTYIQMGDGTYELEIPSGAQTGLKLVSGFTLPANGAADFTIDFDVRKSVVENANGYLLKPALRLVDNAQVGHIAGTVAGELLGEACASPAVYAYEGLDVTPVEEGDENGSVVASSLIDTTDNSYEIGFLVAGDYTVALTCDAATDTAEAVEDITFEQSQNVTVTANETATSDFEVTVTQ